MNKIILLIIFLMFFVSPTISHSEKKGVVHDVILTRVIDGDTIAFEAKWLPDPLKKELSIRVYGVDTPEKGFRAKCESENLKAIKASEFTKNFIKEGKTQISLMDWDKYGGRVLGDVLVDGKSLRQELINNGFAREYFGEAKTTWCE